MRFYLSARSNHSLPNATGPIPARASHLATSSGDASFPYAVRNPECPHVCGENDQKLATKPTQQSPFFGLTTVV
jgi:hypothetical protein